MIISFAGDNVSNSTSWIFYIRFSSRYQVHMRMKNSLSCIGTRIETDIKPTYDAHDRKLVPTLKEWDRMTKELEEKRKRWRRIIEDYDNGRLGSDDGITTQVIPEPPKPPLNLGGYKKLEALTFNLSHERILT